MLKAPTCSPTAYTIVEQSLVFPLKNVNANVHTKVSATEDSWKSEDSLWSQFFYRVDPQELTEVIRFGNKSLQLLSHLTGHYLPSIS